MIPQIWHLHTHTHTKPPNSSAIQEASGTLSWTHKCFQEQLPGRQRGHFTDQPGKKPHLGSDPVKHPMFSITGSYYYSRGTRLQRVGVAERLVQTPHYKWRTYPRPGAASLPTCLPVPEPGKFSLPDVVARNRHFRKGKSPSLRTSPLHPRGWPTPQAEGTSVL